MVEVVPSLLLPTLNISSIADVVWLGFKILLTFFRREDATEGSVCDMTRIFPENDPVIR